MTKKYYAGIGARKTPPEILQLMTCIAAKLESLGYVLRSGGAEGADRAFEAGVTDSANKQVFLADGVISIDAFASVGQFHPAPASLSAYVRKLMARNYHQVMGPEGEPKSSFVICWTPDGCKSHATRTRASGGTGQAVSIADYHKVPLFNLADTADRHRIEKWLFADQPDN